MVVVFAATARMFVGTAAVASTHLSLPTWWWTSSLQMGVRWITCETPTVAFSPVRLAIFNGCTWFQLAQFLLHLQTLPGKHPLHLRHKVAERVERHFRDEARDNFIFFLVVTVNIVGWLRHAKKQRLPCFGRQEKAQAVHRTSILPHGRYNALFAFQRVEDLVLFENAVAVFIKLCEDDP